MPECTPRDCPLVPRVEALEGENKRHTETHKEIFDRLRKIETNDAVQDAHYNAIDAKLDDLTVMVKGILDKPTKRLDSIIAAVIGTVIGALGTLLVNFLAGK